MADDTVLIKGIFDSSGIAQGVAGATASFEQFEAMVQQIKKSLPAIDQKEFLQSVAFGTHAAMAEMEKYQATLKATIQPQRSVIEGMSLAGRAGAAASAGARAWAAGIDQMRASALAAIPPQLSMIKGMSLAGRAGASASAGAAAWSRGLENLRAANVGVAGSFTQSNRAANLMRGSLVTLATQSLGTSSAVGSMAQSVLLFSGGAAGVIAVAGAVLVAAKAFELLTAKEREAAKAHDDLVASFQKRVESESAALGGGSSGRGGARAELQLLDIQQRQLRVQQAYSQNSGDLIGFVIARAALEKNITAQKKLQADLALDEARAERAQIEAKQAPGRDLISGLGTELATLRLGEEAVRRMTVANEATSESERAWALSILSSIQAIERRNKALKEAEKDAHDAAVANRELESALAAISASGFEIQQDFWKEIVKGWDEAREAASDYYKNAQEGLDSLMTAEEIHLEFIEEQRRAFLEVTDAAFGLARVANDVGLIDDNLTNAIGSALDLADAINKIDLQGFTTGNILGGIGAGIGLIGALAALGGPSEHTRLLQENNQRLADLKASLDHEVATLEGLRASREQLEILSGIPLSGRGTKGGARPDMRAIDEFLNEAGLTIEEWAARVEKVTGIDVLDDKGRILAGTLEQVDLALKLLIEDAERIAAEEAARKAAELLEEAARAVADRMADLAEATRQAIEAMLAAQYAWAQERSAAEPGLRDLRRQLSGNDSPQQQFKDALAGFGNVNATSGIMESFQGFDLDDPASREALRQRLLATVTALLEGRFPLEDQSQFGPLLEFLGQGTGILDQFNESVQNATKSLQNVPEGVNLMALEFAAQAAGGGATGSAGAPAPIPFAPGRAFGDARPFRGTDGASLPVTAQYITTGPIIVEALPGMTPEDQARRIKRELAREQMSTDGTPDPKPR